MEEAHTVYIDEHIAIVELVGRFKAWFLDEKVHRENEPAVIWEDGTKIWYINNKRHRENGPAMEIADGGKEWWINGKLHKLDGPAREYINGRKEWWINGNEMKPHIIELFCRRIRNHKLRKLIKLLKNEAFWIWYMNPNNIGGRNAIKKIEYMLKEMKLMI